MTVGLWDSRIFGGFFGDEETAALFADAARVRFLLRFEVALAAAEAEVGVIPEEAAVAIAEAAETFTPDMDGLRAGTEEAGLPVMALLAQLRRACGDGAGEWLHWGATSQDALDTALVLQLREALAVAGERLQGLIETLAALAERERETVMAARTRSQQALPTSFGLKAAGWLAPLLRHRARLAELRPRLLVLQFGGAAGTLAALGDEGLGVADALAQRLELALPPLPWHSQRDSLVELANWYALVACSLGKIGQDVALLAQNEVGEVREGAGGGSSTMPQKANPILSELLVALARTAAGLAGQIQQAQIQEHERGGPGWQMEWLALPQLAVATATALRQAQALLDGLEVDAGRMRANLKASNGLLLAEAATFALAGHMPRSKAADLVKRGCAEAQTSGRHLMDVMAELSDLPLDWRALKEPAGYLGQSEAFIERVLARASKA